MLFCTIFVFDLSAVYLFNRCQINITIFQIKSIPLSNELRRHALTELLLILKKKLSFVSYFYLLLLFILFSFLKF